MKKLNYTDYPEQQMIEIEGVKYSYGVFRHLGIGGLKEGTKVQIVKRPDNGYLTLKKLED